jgi:hypothetical protein
MLTFVYAECRQLVHYAECHYAKCRYAECRGALKNHEIYLLCLHYKTFYFRN